MAISVLVGLALVIVTPAYSFEINGRYLNYGNGMINLDNVTHINRRLNYIVTLPQDELDDYFKQYGSSMSNSGEYLGLLRWFNSEWLDKLDYYFIEIEAYVKFDDFTLTMIEKQRYLKLPSGHARERIRAAYGDEKVNRFQEGLTRFLGGAEPISRLDKSESDKIRSKLTDLSAGYRKIYESGSFSWWPF